MQLLMPNNELIIVTRTPNRYHERKTITYLCHKNKNIFNNSGQNVWNVLFCLRTGLLEGDYGSSDELFCSLEGGEFFSS
jgi:hypothetical protein